MARPVAVAMLVGPTAVATILLPPQNQHPGLVPQLPTSSYATAYLALQIKCEDMQVTERVTANKLVYTLHDTHASVFLISQNPIKVSCTV